MKHLAMWGTIISATTLLAACATNNSSMTVGKGYS